MIDPDEREQAALAHGSKMAAEYLAELDQYDLGKFTEAQWGELINVIVGGYVDYMTGAVND